MGTVEQSVEVAAPLETVYDAWTHYERLPEFMEGVEAVQQRDETHIHLRLAGRELDVEIVEQRPCERIGWMVLAGGAEHGTVAFEPVDGAHTRVTLHIEDDGRGRFERGSAGRVRGDLERFKALLEAAPRG
jgi:uncharacterized membrane protein